MAAIKHNIVANYLGSGWNALMGLAFIPLYIHYLGNGKHMALSVRLLCCRRGWLCWIWV